MAKVWFITGSSRGLGRSLVEAVLEDGGTAVATARNPEQLSDLKKRYPDHLYLVKMDVTDKMQIRSAVDHTIEKFGQIDVLVNNAGFAIIGAAEAYSDEDVRSQLETNLYAPIEITRMVLPHMRKQRSGRILQINSIGGRIGNPGLSIYQAAKFGLSGFSEALAKEVRPLGIWVTSIEPGGLRTGLFASMACAPVIEGYESTVGTRMEQFKNNNFSPPNLPDKVAKVLVELARHPEPPIHLVLGRDAVARLKQADIEKSSEMENWLGVSHSTGADDAVPSF